MQNLGRIFTTLVVLGFLATSLACSSEDAESLAEEACDRQIECEMLDDGDRDQCIEQTQSFYNALEEDGDCWDAVLDSFDCSSGLSCDADESTITEECGDEEQAVAENCS